jgi:hypothetical protein
MFNRLSIVFLTLLLSSPALFAAEQTSEHSIVGLFSPDREKDLRQVMEDVPDVKLIHVDYENARVTLKYDLKALFPNANPKKPPTNEEVEKRLNELIGQASENTFTLKADSKIPREKLTRLEIKIGLLDCKGCRYGAYLTAMKEEGVEQATVDKVLTAWIDSTKTNQTVIEAALKKAGVGVPEKK